ncbi:hypothetical protein GGR52DRAFT_539644 [Hypoxylon sp. FL1284]|nr:hypothetical protein GGR52DRAFT_539644 [Hypoxylon sp. FL1284]
MVHSGLEASWARQQSSTSPHNDNSAPNRRSKGPVITRYPPPSASASASSHPSHHTSPGPRYDNSPPQPYQSGQLPAYLPPPPLPPPSYNPGFGGHPPSQSPYDRYGLPPPPGPPGPPGLPPIPPPSMNPPPPYHPPYSSVYNPPPPVHGPYDHHSGPPPGPPNQYFSNGYLPGPGRASPYPPNHYPPAPSYSSQHPYSSSSPPSYPPQPPFPALPAPYMYNGPPPGYTQGDYDSPHHPPPPPTYHQYIPPEPLRGQPYDDDRDRRHRSRDRQRRYDDRHSSDTWHSQDAWHNPPPLHDQNYRDDYREDWRERPSHRDDRSSRKRGHGRPMDERRRDRSDRFHDRFHPYRNSDNSDRHQRRRQHLATTQDTPRNRAAPAVDAEKPASTKTNQDGEEREPGEILSELASEHGTSEVARSPIPDKDCEDTSWDERTIFMEPPLTGQVDPIAGPLPTQYSEEVMIPPAFDAKALISRYITPRNIDDFAQSIRETRDWQVVQHHPAFLDPAEICVEKLDDYNRTVQKDLIIRGNRRDRGFNPHDTGRQRYNNSYGPGRQNGKNRDSRHKPDHKKRRWNDFPDNADTYRSEKRHREIPQDDVIENRYRPTSPEPGEVVEEDAEESPYEPSETPVLPIKDSAWAIGPGAVTDARQERLEVNDSTYILTQDRSEQNHDVAPHDITDKLGVRPLTPKAHLTNNSPPYSRPSSRGSPRNRPMSRRSSFGTNISGSSLDDIERELLGLGGPPKSDSDTETGSPKRPNGTALKPKRRKQQVNEAYSRRW